MPESPCIVCGETCLHTEDDDQPLCDSCTQLVVWKRLILDVALGITEVTPEFIESLQAEAAEAKAARGEADDDE